MTEKDEDDYRNNNNCQFCEKTIELDKFRDHCHLTRNYRGLAHSKCNFNVTQDKSNFIPFMFHNYSNHHCHMFFKKLVDKKNDNLKFKFIPKTNEEYFSVRYGRTRLINIHLFYQVA